MAKTVRLEPDAGRVALPDGNVYETGVASEIRVIEVSPGATGTYTLTHNSNETNAIDVGASPGTIQAELVGLTGIDAGDVTLRRGNIENDEYTPHYSADYEAQLPLVVESDETDFTDHDLVVDDSEVEGGSVRVRVIRPHRADGTVDVVLTDEEYERISPSSFGSVLNDAP
jgi:hypothetical protein